VICVSPDIPKGSRWAAELWTELEAINCGIVCIVPGNADEPWLNFEAGALSKSVATSRVYPFLLGLTPSDVKGPLSQFQATLFTKQEVHKLAASINDLSKHKLPTKELDQDFEACWPQLEGALNLLAIEPKLVVREMNKPMIR
jgi:hypothetical protein